MKFKYWIKAARLRTLPLAFSCILLSSSLVIINHIELSYKELFLTLTTTLLLQILSNFANDYGDAIKGADKNRTGEQRMVQSGKISKSQMKLAIVIISILTLTVGLYLIFSVFHKDIFKILIFLFLGIGSIIAAIKYTVGKSAYGYSGFGDVFVFLFFGLLSVVGSYFLFTKEINFHKGIDIAHKTESDIRSLAGGEITYSGKKYGYGNLVEVSHLNGYVTRYAHNNRNLVKVGELVKKGQIIAKMGSTGHSTGPHVHLEVLKNNRHINPNKFIHYKEKFSKNN